MPKLISDHPRLEPRTISARLRSELVYFAVLPEPAHELADGEYLFDYGQLRTILDDGVLYLVSPLDTDKMTEVELSEEQEDLLIWITENMICSVRVVE